MYDEIREKKYKDLFEDYKKDDLYDSSAELIRQPRTIKKLPVQRFRNQVNPNMFSMDELLKNKRLTFEDIQKLDYK